MPLLKWFNFAPFHFLSFLKVRWLSVYKGKGDALDCGSYRGIKLLDQAMKVFERVIEGR